MVARGKLASASSFGGKMVFEMCVCCVVGGLL
jgi:hypothetical protein